MRCAASPVTSRPRISIRPALGASSPESRLMSVVLPAPFGPITACRRPTWHSSDTPFTAARPPNRRRSPAVRKATSATTLPIKNLRKAARHEQHREHDETAEQQLPVLGPALE